MSILITGVAGFIGFSLAKKLLDKNKTVYGIDNLNSYYDVNLKKKRIKILNKYKKFNFFKLDLKNQIRFTKILRLKKILKVIHLAAQAGVRYSIDHPQEYISSNLNGFYNVLESCRKNKINHLIYASTSSVYGKSKKKIFSENNFTENPLSLYAATKKSNELLAYAYSNIHKMKTTGLRFFTVYGPWGRPDMSLFKFTKAIIKNEKIELYNFGNHTRDFTYIDDVTSCIELIVTKKAKFNKKLYQVYNISNSKPVKLLKYVNLIEKNLSKKAKINYLPLQQGDVIKTFGSNKEFIKNFGYRPKIRIEEGIKEFIKWYINYHKQK
jgi:UDP-glucuronate 4-epimerase